VRIPPAPMPFGTLRTRGSGERPSEVERPRSLLPSPMPPAPTATGMASGAPSHRLGEHSRSDRWLTGRLDRLDDRMRDRRERLLARWDRLNRESRHEGLITRSRRRWYLLVDRVERRVALWRLRWYRFVYRIATRCERIIVWVAFVPYRVARPLTGGRRKRLVVRRIERGRRPVVSRMGLVAAGLPIVLALGALASVLLANDPPGRSDAGVSHRSDPVGPASGPVREQESPPPPAASSDLKEFTNEQAGYLFSYPGDWTVSSSGAATLLSDPIGEILISFDSAPSGSLVRSSERAVEQLTDTYAGSEIVAREIDSTPQGFPSIAVGGTATEVGGGQIRFLLITVQGPDENRALLIRFPADPDTRALSSALEVVGSFRITSAGQGTA
jgi:hypothetical protein